MRRKIVVKVKIAYKRPFYCTMATVVPKGNKDFLEKLERIVQAVITRLG